MVRRLVQRKNKMTKREPTLSICLITYNRASSLGKLLLSLAGEIPEDVDLHVSDNASSDQTAQVVLGLQHRLPLHYHRNRTNIGAERNVLSAIGFGRGQFVLVCGDDDRFNPGAIRKLAAALRACPPEVDAVYLNASLAGGRSISHFNFDGLHVFPTADPSPMSKMGNITFLGSVCLRRRSALELIGRTKIEKGLIRKPSVGFSFFQFPQAYLFLETLRRSRAFGVMADPIQMVVGGGDTFSYPRYVRTQALHLGYVLDLRTHYPQYPIGDSFQLKYVCVAYFMLANFSSSEPRLAPLRRLYGRLLASAARRDGRQGLAFILRLHDFITYLPLSGPVLELLYRLLLRRSMNYHRAWGATEVYSAFSSKIENPKWRRAAESNEEATLRAALDQFLFP